MCPKPAPVEFPGADPGPNAQLIPSAAHTPPLRVTSSTSRPGRAAAGRSGVSVGAAGGLRQLTVRLWGFHLDLHGASLRPLRSGVSTPTVTGRRADLLHQY